MNADYYRNKHLLGELTFGDVMEIARIEGEFSIGKSWLPITLVKFSRSKSKVGIFMSSLMEDGPDVTIPVDAKVKVEGNIVRVQQMRDPVTIRLESDIDILGPDALRNQT